MRLIDIVIILVGVISIMILILDDLYENKNVACLFNTGYYIFHTGRWLHSFTIIKIKVGAGVCIGDISNHYTNVPKKNLFVKSHSTKYYIVFGRNQYYSLELTYGYDFVVTVISFEKKRLFYRPPK